MYWNNRLFLHEKNGAIAVHEVFYEDDTHEIIGWTESPICLGEFESVEDAIQSLHQISKDIVKKAPLKLSVSGELRE